MTSFTHSYARRLDDLDVLRQFQLSHLGPRSGRGFCLAPVILPRRHRGYPYRRDLVGYLRQHVLMRQKGSRS